MRSRRPVATGGITSGSETNVSITVRPKKRPRASAQPTERPNGTIRSVAPPAQAIVNHVIRQASVI
jgi:hypothetical protein